MTPKLKPCKSCGKLFRSLEWGGTLCEPCNAARLRLLELLWAPTKLTEWLPDAKPIT